MDDKHVQRQPTHNTHMHRSLPLPLSACLSTSCFLKCSPQYFYLFILFLVRTHSLHHIISQATAAVSGVRSQLPLFSLLWLPLFLWNSHYIGLCYVVIVAIIYCCVPSFSLIEQAYTNTLSPMYLAHRNACYTTVTDSPICAVLRTH